MCEFPKSLDDHLNNLIRRCREELQANHPVQAHMWLSDIARYVNGKKLMTMCKVCGVKIVAPSFDHCNSPDCVPF